MGGAKELYDFSRKQIPDVVLSPTILKYYMMRVLVLFQSANTANILFAATISMLLLHYTHHLTITLGFLSRSSIPPTSKLRLVKAGNRESEDRYQVLRSRYRKRYLRCTHFCPHSAPNISSELNISKVRIQYVPHSL
jgi:hypothetical protein